MVKRLVIAAVLMLLLPSYSSAWVTTVKIGSGAGSVKAGVTSQGFGNYTASLTIAKTGTTQTAGYFKSSAASQTFTVAPAAGYKVSMVVVDSLNATNPLGTYTVSAGTPAKNHSMVVYYTPTTYDLTLTQALGGNISVRQLDSLGRPFGPYTMTGFTGLKAGWRLRVYLWPNSDYAVTGVTVNGAPPSPAPALSGVRGDGTSIDMTVAAGANTVTAAFGLIPQVTARLTASTLVATAGDTITVDASMTSANGPVSYTFDTIPAASVTQHGAQATVKFASAGSYLVRVTAVNGSATSSAAATIKVRTVLEAANGVCLSCHTNRNQSSMTAYQNGSHGGATNANTYTCLQCHNPTGSLLHPYAAEDAAQVQKGDPALAAAAGYVGSGACQGCHPQTFATWSNTLHNKGLKQLSETGPEVLLNRSATAATGRDDFTAALNFNSYETLLDNSGKRYDNPFNSRKPNAPVLSYDPFSDKRYIAVGTVKYEVVRAVGGNAKWKQLYQTKIGNAYYTLSVQWDELTGRYEEYAGNNWYGSPGTGSDPTSWNAGNTPIFNSYSGALETQVAAKMMASYGAGHIGGPANGSWDNRCAGCHHTAVTAEFSGSESAGEVKTGYVELNVGCEACHGLGKDHASSPAATNILQPQKALSATGNYFKAQETCGQCHSRTVGTGRLGYDSAHLVSLPSEAPSVNSGPEAGTLTFYNVHSPQRLNDFVSLYNPAIFGTITLDGTLQYDGRNFPRYKASSQDRQSFEDLQQGKHGAIYQSQPGKGQGLTCWSCHDPHAANGGNLRTSVNGVTTSRDDNSLCLACHNGNSANAATSDADFAALPKTAIGDRGAELAALNTHLAFKVGHTITAAQYLQSIASDGTPFGPFGRNTIRAGQCVACHMPLVARSAGTFTPSAGDTTKEAGDIHSHTMRTIRFSDISTPHRTGGTETISSETSVTGGSGRATSCSVCHVSGG